MPHDPEPRDGPQPDAPGPSIELLHHEPAAGRGGWSSTLGLWSGLRHPEVVVFGLEPEVTEELLAEIAELIADGGRFEAGQSYDDVLVGYPICFGRVTAAQVAAQFDAVRQASGAVDVPMLQLVYPDKHGRWPWQPGVRSGFRELQPVLEREPDAGAEGSA